MCSHSSTGKPISGHVQQLLLKVSQKCHFQEEALKVSQKHRRDASSVRRYCLTYLPYGAPRIYRTLQKRCERHGLP